MKELASTDSCGDVMARAWRSRTATKALLVAGIAAVGVYGLGDLLSGLLYEGYSFKDQAISELAAFGSPVRPLMVAVVLVHGVLVVAFGVGLWRSADRRSLRWVGPLLIAAGLVGLPNHTVFAMSSRWMEGASTTPCTRSCRASGASSSAWRWCSPPLPTEDPSGCFRS